VSKLLLALALLLATPAAAQDDDSPPARMTSADGRLQAVDAYGVPRFDAAGDPIWDKSAQEQALDLFDQAVQASRGLAPGSTMWMLSVAPKFKEALGFQPDFPEARYNLGMAYLHANDQEGAVEQFMAVLEGDPDQAEARVALGIVYERQGRLSEAERLYAMGIGREGGRTNVDLLNGQARLLLKKGRANDAVTASLSVLRVNSNSIDAFNTLGLAYMELGRFETARFVFQKAKSLPGGDEAAMLETNLGLVYWRMGREFQATASFQAALELDSTEIGARVNLAHLRLRNLDYQGAYDLLRPAADANEGNQIIQLSYAVSLRGIGRLEEAEQIYEDIAGDIGSDLRDEALLNLGILQGDFLKDYASSIDTYNEYIAVRESRGFVVAEDHRVRDYIAQMEKLKRKEDRRKQREARESAPPSEEAPPAEEEGATP
jgi:Flp pilus assembly protein TadD